MENQNTFDKPVNTASHTMTTNNENDNSNKAVTGRMRYKASKYHYKIQNHLNTNYISKNLAIPQGYEKYLQPFQS